MRQSNTYVILFTIGLTVVVAGVLSSASQLLAPAQKRSIEFDTKSQILGAVMELEKGMDVLAIYDDRIKSLVVNLDGEEVTENQNGDPIIAENVSVEGNFKRPKEERLYPVFKFINADDPEKVEAYILPVFGSGLWDRIWGFIALDEDFVAIKGVSFAHRAETPGLGARISSEQIQDRYIGKKVYDDDGNLVSVEMVKGEKGGNAYADDPHKVDGLSGATITARGVNDMLENYLNYYESYIEKVKSGEQVASIED